MPVPAGTAVTGLATSAAQRTTKKRKDLYILCGDRTMFRSDATQAGL